MNVLDAALRICVLAFVVGSLAVTGLGVAPRDALFPLKNVRFVLLTLGVGWLVCPAIAYVLLLVVPLDGPYATGLVLLALAPGAPFAPALAGAARADPAYMAAFMVLTAAATVILMPLGVPLLIPGSTADAGAIARPMLWLVLLPLVAGTITRGLRPSAADRLAPSLSAITRATTIALLLLMIPVLGPGVLGAIGSFAILTTVIFVALVTVTADILGAALTDAQRNVLTIGMCTRNVGAALAPAAIITPDRRVIVMIGIAVPVTFVMSAIAARRLAHRRLRAR